MSAPRDSYKAVGAAMRDVVACAASMQLTQRQHRVLLAILGLTAGWSRLADDVAHSQLVDATGIDQRHVRRAVRDLADLGLITYEPGASPRGEARRSSVIGLRPGADSSPPSAEGPGADGSPLSALRPGADSDQDRGPIPTKTGGRRWPPSREVPRRTAARAREADAPAPQRALNGNALAGQVEALYRNGHRGATQIADACGVDPDDVRPIIERLEATT